MNVDRNGHAQIAGAWSGVDILSRATESDIYQLCHQECGLIGLGSCLSQNLG